MTLESKVKHIKDVIQVAARVADTGRYGRISTHYTGCDPIIGYAQADIIAENEKFINIYTLDNTITTRRQLSPMMSYLKERGYRKPIRTISVTEAGAKRLY